MQGSKSELDDNTFTPGPTQNTVRAADGTVLTVPKGWALLPPGDAALTRRVKVAGEHWVVQEKVGRRMFSRGVWASAATIDRIRCPIGLPGLPGKEPPAIAVSVAAELLQVFAADRVRART